ncbi:hypothetical protein [Treponema sp. C6A8]|uniref:hypothetical protein n=1 Tax=Treponema sp. C6A8 TaxID=1410609 RepID=UPI0004850C76|nr:hypothetical protein [Treponema sp. C6A8]
MKKEKKVKLVKAKKIPGLFKKRYTEKSLEKKLLKKLYVPADIEYIKNLFKDDESKPGFLKADTSGQIEKKELKRLKTLAKEIKKNKAGFKLVPFAAVGIFIAALVLGVILFKDVAVKKAITSAMQSAFGAKTDIASVHLKILDAKLEVKNLEQASSDDEMKNLFQIADLTFDFNLTEALRGKVDIENLTIGEVLFNTDRKKSGKLKKVEKLKKQQEKTAEKEAVKAAKKGTAAPAKKNDLMAKTQNTLNSMFADYNPENIMSNMQENLKSPVVAQNAQKTAEELVEKWQNEPAKIEESVKQMQALAEDVQKFDYSKLSDPSKIKEMIELVNSSINTGNEITSKTKSLVNDVEKDSAKVKSLSDDIQKAIDSDKKLLDAEISKFTTLKDKGVKNVFNDMITAFVYGMADQYSPKARGYINKALELKAKHDASAAKKNSDKQKAKKLKLKKRIAQRAGGRYVYYKKDRVPKFLLEKAYGSGDGWSLNAQEFSSDADKRGSESLLEAALALSGTENKLHAVIDARSESENSFVNATYAGKNLPSDVVIDSYGMKSKSAVNCTIVIDDLQEGVRGEGILDLNVIQILSPSFEPKAVYDIYKSTLDSVKTMRVRFNYKWNEEDGLALDLKTDAGDVFQRAFTNTFNKEIIKITEQSRQMVTQLLSEKTGIATDKISEFSDIEKRIKDSDKMAQGLKKQMESKKKEMENFVNGAADRAKKQAEAELAKAKAEAEEKARAEAERLKKETEEAVRKEAENQAKNLLKGFGF